ncbi:MAG: hypothetical protein ACR2PS_02495 [Pseudomonadales bacterium]
MSLLLLSFGMPIYACSGDAVPFEEFESAPHVKISGPYLAGALEKKHMIQIRETGEVLPFGYAYKHWVSFKAKMKVGDKIYFYKSTKDGVFQDGYMLVRKECVIDTLPRAVS